MSETLAYTTGDPSIAGMVTVWAPPFQAGFLFIAPTDYDLTVESMVLYCWRDLFDNDGTFRCSVYEVVNNAPSGSAIEISTFKKSDIGPTPGDNGEVTLTFSPIVIGAGTSKAFIFTYPDYVAVYYDGGWQGNRIGTWYWPTTNPQTAYGIGFLGTSNPTGSGWVQAYSWLPSTITGTATIVRDPSRPGDLTTFPPTRPDTYDPDVIWQPGEWTDPTTYVPGAWGSDYVATGGGRWGQNLVVAGNKKVYYEAF